MKETKKTAPEKGLNPMKFDGLKLDIFDNEAKSVGKKNLDERLWTRPLNKELISRMVMVENAGRRQATSKTKTRGEVSGGGRKPWRQKGTGRARAGSTRSPIWRGGGITFGPTGKQNFSKKANKKEFALALASALSCWRNHGRIAVVRDFSFEKPNTKMWLEFARKLAPSFSKLDVPKIVFVFGESSENLILSSANLRQHLFVTPQSLTISQILWSNIFVIFESALPALEKRLDL